MSIFNDLYSFNASASIADINQLRSRLEQNIGQMTMMRAKFDSSDFTQLMNYHQYCLNIFDNMINTRKVMESDTYYSTQPPVTMDFCVDNPVLGRKMLVWNQDGTTKIIGENDLCRKNEEWERQFTPSMLQNPPMWTFPPSNVWNIKQAQNYRAN
jgi:hypothetical protein